MMKRIVRCSIIFLLVMVLCSCGSWGIRKPDQISSDQANLVSRDFVTAISRLRGFSPRETTVQFHAPRSLFARKLHDAMRISGYGIQIVSNKEIGQNHVAYKSEQYEDTNGTTVAYQVNVGKVRLSREYEIRVGRVFPIAALSVLGATSSTDNNIDNSIFSGSEDNSGWMSIGPVQKSILTTDNGRIDPLKILDSIRIQRSAKKPKRNMANLGGSNYSDLFKQYTNKKEEILTFPFDSLTMGNTNKKIAWEMVKLFDPATDIFSVVGCSHGYSKIANGNALLATGRANRVKEELIYNNVPAEKILDESCWAGGPVKNMPARGVVLTLRKRV